MSNNTRATVMNGLKCSLCKSDVLVFVDRLGVFTSCSNNQCSYAYRSVIGSCTFNANIDVDDATE